MTIALPSQPWLRVRTAPSLIAFIGVVVLNAGTAMSMCANPEEAGKWTNIDASESLHQIQIALTSCGDQVLNGVQTTTRIGATVVTKQSTGALYKRPRVLAQYRTSKGKRWLVAKVPTGGYVDNMWMRTYVVKGKTRLFVYILHKSLDSKPDATSKFWFSK